MLAVGCVLGSAVSMWYIENDQQQQPESEGFRHLEITRVVSTQIVVHTVIVTRNTIIEPLETATETIAALVDTATIQPSDTATSEQPTFTPAAATTTLPISSATATRTATLASSPTATWTPRATYTPVPSYTPRPTYTLTPTLRPGQVCYCSGDLYNCDDFENQGAAQACFDYCQAQGYGDVHDLDRDKDGQVCEG
jgi:hypothetical protein